MPDAPHTPRPPSRRPELVAPAGSPAALAAALEHGADAVYLGLRHLSARANAPNFALADLGPAVARAHAAGARVYVTLNTLVRADERALLVRMLTGCAAAEVDAVVFQDLGLPRVAAEAAPGLRLHASTQLAVHDAAGVAALARLGVRRVVLARELAIAEIARIRQAVPDVELEVFVHGALCYCASGLCLMSALAPARRRGKSGRGRSAAGLPVEPLAGRPSEEVFSGNRGRCTQPCRRPFFRPDGTALGLIFSLRDLLGVDCVPELVGAGVDALKIEGRLHGPAFVGAAVHAYRGAVDQALGQPPPSDWTRETAERALRAQFSRTISTGYLCPVQAPARPAHGQPLVDPHLQGHRGISAGRVLACAADGLRLAVTRPFAVGDRLLLEAPRLAPYNLAVTHIADPSGRPLGEALPGREAIVNPPARPVPPGAQARLVFSAEAVRRFTPSAAAPGPPAPARPLGVRLVWYSDARRVTLTATAGDTSVARDIDLGDDPAPPLATATLARILAENDEAAFCIEEVVVRAAAPLRLPQKALPRMRRDILRRLGLVLEFGEAAATSPGAPHPPPAASEPAAALATERWIVRIADPALVSADWLAAVDEVEFLLDPQQPDRLADVCRAVPPDRLWLVLPPLLRGPTVAGVQAALAAAAALGTRRFVVAHLGQRTLLPAVPNAEVGGDSWLYAANPDAAETLLRGYGLTRLTAPLELDAPALHDLLASHGASSVVTLYAHVPVFHGAVAPHALDPAGRLTPVSGAVLDALDHPYEVRPLGPLTLVYDGRPLCLAGALPGLRRAGGRLWRIDLTGPAPATEGRELIQTLRAGHCPQGALPGNLTREWL